MASVCIQRVRAELGMNDIYKMFFSFIFNFWETSVGELDIVLNQERMLKDFNISNKGGCPKIQWNIVHILRDVRSQILTLDGKLSTKKMRESDKAHRG